MSYFRGACGVRSWDRVSNAEVCRCNISERGKDIGCEVRLGLEMP